MRDIAAISLKLLAPLSKNVRKEIQEKANRISLRAGQLLFNEGEQALAFYIVVSGTLGIFKQQSEGEKNLIALVKSGEILGELLVLGDNVRTASAVALRDSELLRLSKADFIDLLQRYPEIYKPLSFVLAKRLKSSTQNDPIRVRPKVYTFLSLTDDVDIAATTNRLADTLKADCGLSVFVQMDQGTVISQVQLAELEDAYDLVFLCCHSQSDPRLNRYARQSERICLVMNSKTRHAMRLSKDLLDLQHDHQMVDLFILYDDASDTPHATKSLLERVQVNRHFHIRTNLKTEWQRWGRMLSSRGVGLVLSGGGARAYAHVGVIRALAEHGVSIDFVAGSSMGSIISASLAMGQTLDEMEASVKQAFVASNPLSDYTLPLKGLVRGRKVEKLLEHHFGNAEITDLWLPYFCVSTNLTYATTQMHDEGLLRHALRASISLPGILPPVISPDGVLIDGSVINNIPCSEMAKKCFGPIIAVNVARDLGITPKSWRDLTSRPLLTRIFRPEIINLLMRSGTVSGAENIHRQTEAAFKIINPPMGTIDLRDWKAYEETVEIGYQHTRDLLEQDVELSALGN